MESRSSGIQLRYSISLWYAVDFDISRKIGIIRRFYIIQKARPHAKSIQDKCSSKISFKNSLLYIFNYFVYSKLINKTSMRMFIFPKKLNVHRVLRFIFLFSYFDVVLHTTNIFHFWDLFCHFRKCKII